MTMTIEEAEFWFEWAKNNAATGLRQQQFESSLLCDILKFNLN